MFLSEKAGSVRLQVHVQPNAKRSEIVGLHGDALKIKIKAVPEDGKANAELVSFLAELLGVSRASVVVDSGLSSRAKGVLISGVSASYVRAKLTQNEP